MSVWRQKSHNETSRIVPSLSFTCKPPLFRSGAEGNRTPDLRRAKSDAECRRRSPLFRNSCKTKYLPLGAFVSVRRCSRGLVYYWCTGATQDASAPSIEDGAFVCTAGCIDTDPSAGRCNFGRSEKTPSSRWRIRIMRCGSPSLKLAVPHHMLSGGEMEESMVNYNCVRFGVQHAETVRPPARCVICEDERCSS